VDRSRIRLADPPVGHPVISTFIEGVMSKSPRHWPPDRIRRLVELWPDLSKTIPGMARELGVSRSAVKLRAEYLALSGRPIGRRDPIHDERELIATDRL
jgi:hypothetical protein